MQRSDGAPAPHRVPPPDHAEGWFDRPMRWAQLTFVENDPATFDRDFWLDYLRRIKADAICLSAGGYIAYYPTQVPLHYRSAWLSEGDLFGEMVEACRRLGMVVLARVDPHAVHRDVYEAHPDWIAADPEGKPRSHWSMPEAWVTCALGPYNFEFMTAVIEEIVSLYGVDGIFANRWAGHGPCYCVHCRRAFEAASGLALPRDEAPADRVWRAYRAWRQERLFALAAHWDAAIRRINPAARFIPNSGGGALSELDMRRLGQSVDILFADRQARRGVMAPWANGKHAKELRATLGSKPIGGIFSVGVEEAYRWKDSVQSEAEIRIWVAEGVANGLRPWFTKFGATIRDGRWLGVVEDLYRRYHAWEPYLRNRAPLAQVAVVYSQRAAQLWGGQHARREAEEPILGVCQALIEARIPFEMVHDTCLEDGIAERFKTLILPNVASLSVAQCDALRRFVDRGGGLVATFKTSLYDEEGRRRDDFGLADLFGVRCDGEIEGPMKNAYLTLETDPASGQRHPLLAGFSEADRIIHGTYRVPIRLREETLRPPLTLVPSYPDLPMEEVYPRLPHTETPEVAMRHFGRGRVVFFPWNIDQIFWEILQPDHGRLLANAVRWVTQEPPVVVVEGPGLLDVTVWQQAASLTVHLVNLTNPMTMRGPFREIIPVGAQLVRVRLPEGAAARAVRLLAAEQAVPFEQEGAVLTTTVPSVADHEVIAIEL
ncbi:MAG TPA: alpha-amylase family protein [Limnochordia bacterium]